ncbi:MAG: DUF1080 domain-containing protein [Planctomycetes bacterium]|nr:DUF1080 domain-containing protein [Planctomycetota bacterium]
MKKTIIIIIVQMVLLAAFSAFARADEVTADILCEKGVTDMEKKDYAAAETAFLKALESFPGHLKSCMKLGEIYEMSDEKQTQAIEYYTRAKELLDEKEKPTADEKKQKISIEKKLEQIDKLGTDYKTERSNYLKTLLGIANDAKKDKRYDFTVKVYKEMLQLDPKNADALKGRKEAEALIPGNKDRDPEPGEENELFNGDDIDGWTKDVGSWEVDGGKISSTAKKGESFMLINKESESGNDFASTLKFKGNFSSNDELTGAGIVFGYTDVSRAFYAVRVNGNEVMITRCNPGRNNDGSLHHTHTMLCRNRLNTFKENEFNTLTVEMKNNVINIFLNDKKCITNEPLNSLPGQKAGIIVTGGTIKAKSMSVTKQ